MNVFICTIRKNLHGSHELFRPEFKKKNPLSIVYFSPHQKCDNNPFEIRKLNTYLTNVSCKPKLVLAL